MAFKAYLTFLTYLVCELTFVVPQQQHTLEQRFGTSKMKLSSRVA